MVPLGKKQLEQLTAFTGTALCFSLAAAIGGLYLTDWKVVSVHIPFYGGKFAKRGPPPKACD